MDYDCKVCGHKFISKYYLDEHICRVGANIPPRKTPTIIDIGPTARAIAGCESCAALRGEVEEKHRLNMEYANEVLKLRAEVEQYKCAAEEDRQFYREEREKRMQAESRLALLEKVAEAVEKLRMRLPRDCGSNHCTDPNCLDVRVLNAALDAASSEKKDG